ncbi:MAG: NADP oxidoreductase [Bacteroidetes bacterium]|nr:MAG: NADP oxidoreductase [Bacteroidota bacterium]
MKITILGTGMVGMTIAEKLTTLGHQITMGTRDPETTISRPTPATWKKIPFGDWLNAQNSVVLETFENSAKEADLVLNATSGGVTLKALDMVGKDLNGKILIDIANPLDFSNGMPPTLSVCNTDSLGEQIQARFPEVKVVKSLNTMNTYIMMHPETIPGDHTVFVSGNDSEAKKAVSNLLQEIGWTEGNIIDLGDISTSRGTEMLLPVWLRLWGALGHANFNFQIQQA